jgi:hypothetical protein
MNYITIAQANDPWQPYDNNKNKQAVVPEPAAYGAMMTGSILLALFLRKYFRGRN